MLLAWQQAGYPKWLFLFFWRSENYSFQLLEIEKGITTRLDFICILSYWILMWCIYQIFILFWKYVLVKKNKTKLQSKQEFLKWGCNVSVLEWEILSQITIKLHWAIVSLSAGRLNLNQFFLRKQAKHLLKSVVLVLGKAQCVHVLSEQ